MLGRCVIGHSEERPRAGPAAGACTSALAYGVSMPAEKFEGEHVDASPEAGRGGDAAPARVLVASEAGLTIRRMADVMDVIGAAYDADALILTADDVDAGFFDLRTGLAGELFQKATQYAVRLALVLPDPAVHGPRWTELAFEHRRHQAVRIVRSRVEADAWLAS